MTKQSNFNQQAINQVPESNPSTSSVPNSSTSNVDFAQNETVTYNPSPQQTPNPTSQTGPSPVAPINQAPTPQQSAVNLQPANNATEANAQPNMTSQYLNRNQASTLTPKGPMASASFHPFAILVAGFLKPLQTFKEEENQISNFKNSLILASISLLVVTVLNFLVNIITTLMTFKFKFESVKGFFVGDNLMAVFVKSPLLNLTAILAVAGVFYVIAMILKKQNFNYSKALAAVAISITPYILLIGLFPILGKIYRPLTEMSLTITFVYSLIMLYEMIALIADFKQNKLIYGFISLALILSVGNHIYGKIAMEFGASMPTPGNSSQLTNQYLDDMQDPSKLLKNLLGD